MRRQRLAALAAAGGMVGFAVLLAGVLMVSVPGALMLVGAAGMGLSAFALFYDPDRSRP